MGTTTEDSRSFVGSFLLASNNRPRSELLGSQKNQRAIFDQWRKREKGGKQGRSNEVRLWGERKYVRSHTAASEWIRNTSFVLFYYDSPIMETARETARKGRGRRPAEIRHSPS